MTNGHNRTESEPEQIACSLPDDDLQRRLREWNELGSEALITENTESNVKTTVWRRRGDDAVRLKSLVDAERRCCSFLGFDLEESEDEITMKITFPPSGGNVDPRSGQSGYPCSVFHVPRHPRPGRPHSDL